MSVGFETLLVRDWLVPDPRCWLFLYLAANGATRVTMRGSGFPRFFTAGREGVFLSSPFVVFPTMNQIFMEKARHHYFRSRKPGFGP